MHSVNKETSRFETRDLIILCLSIGFLFGIREFTLRLWPALFGCCLAYAAGSLLYGRHPGLFATTVPATNVKYYALSQNIILDMPGPGAPSI